MIHALLYLAMAAAHLMHLLPVGHHPVGSTWLTWCGGAGYLLLAASSFRECRKVRRWLARRARRSGGRRSAARK